MGTHDWGIISQTIGTVLAPLKGGGGAPVPLTPPEPPPPPPAPPGGDGASAGAAAQAVKDAVAALGKITTELTDLDASANAKLEAIVAAGQAGKAELDRVEKDVEDKCAELGPRLETPQGQRELQDYVEQRLGQARTVINEAMQTADDNARQTRELTDRYAGVGAEGTTGSGGPTTAAGGGPGGGDTPAGGAAGAVGGGADTPAGGPAGAGGVETTSQTNAEPAVQPAAAGNTGAGMMPMGAGMPMMPMGSGMPMGGGMGGIPLTLPSLGGGGLGGLPSFGGDPMSALSGLGGGDDNPVGFQDDAAQTPPTTPPPGDGTALTSTHSDDATGGDGKGEEGGGQTTPAGTPIGTTAAVETADDTGGKGDGAGATGAGDTAVGASPPPPKTTEVALPNGATTEARSPVGAAAVRAVLNGASVSEGYAQQGVNLPPPGTPVTDPVPPTQLKAGDVGVWKDHMVMALGNKQVLVNGQVQPQESVGSGPDFLGWIDPTKLANPPAQA